MASLAPHLSGNGIDAHVAKDALKVARHIEARDATEAARELDTDKSEEAFDKIVKRIAKAPPPKDDKKKD